MPIQVFVSHTQRDSDFCDHFDRACARVGIKAFRSEFETVGTPPWLTIKEAMAKSQAMFLLVGQQLVAAQASVHDPQWKYTQNWIAYEIGLACQRGIDVWVYCDENVTINFPVPYFNNYVFGQRSQAFEFIRAILNGYSEGSRFPLGTWKRDVECPYENCGQKFNLHTTLPPDEPLICPQCLSELRFPKGFLTSDST